MEEYVALLANHT
jgi:hypothetical protein